MKSRLIIFSQVLLMTFGQLFQFVSGQTQPTTPDYIPRVIPPAPNAASLGKYGQIPVGLFTGIPQISIPVYDIKTSKLSLSINLSYHASGIKVDQIASWVGLNWSLNAGGVITRSVVGKPDDAGGYLSEKPPLASNLNTFNDWQYLEAALNSKDTEPDMFFFNFGNHSGKFIFGEDNKPIIIPNSPIKITYESGNFKIVDENGTIYQFNNKEFTEAGSYPGGLSSSFVSSWYLTQITSADLSESINFYYKNGSWVTQEKTYSYSESIGNYWVPYECGNGAQQSTCVSLDYKHEINSPSISYRNTTPVLLDYVLFKNGKIEFLTASDRQDITGDRLTGIKVYTQNAVTGLYSLIKFTKLEQDYYYSPQQNQFNHENYKQYRLRLLKVYDYNASSNSRINEYSFEYNTNPLPPVNNYAQDKWGHFNDQYQNQGLLQQHSENYQNRNWTVGNANRAVNTETVKNGIIRKIYYPTGGYTEFEFESNSYIEGPGQVSGGGIRIKKLINYDGISLVTTQSFVYTVGTLVSTYAAFDNIILKKESYGVIGLPGTSCITYYTPGEKKIFNSTSSYALESISGSPVVYSTVTKYEGTESDNTGKTEYTYKVVLNSYLPVAVAFDAGVYQVSNAWENGHLLKEVSYKNGNGGNYVPVSETIYDYYKINGSTGRGLKVGNTLIVRGCFNLPPTDYYWYYYFDYPIYSGIYLLKEKRTKLYDTPGGFVQESSKYTYDNLLHYQPTKIEVTNSLGDLLATVNKYPHDFAQAGNVYQKMVERNIITPVVEKLGYKNGLELNRTKTNYIDTWFGDGHLISPVNVETKKGANNYESRFRYYRYDTYGNPLEFSKENDSKNSYIWDYNNTYPIAEVINSDVAAIAYTSFEADGKGNWSYSGLAFADGSVPTGKRAYYVSTGSITKTGLSTTSGYIISYWTKNTSAFSIAGTVSGYPIQGRTFGEWRYFEHKITGVSQVTISGSGLIDELRLYPEKALMTTMTYAPLIGITSQCDANNMINYYEYDEFNRLILVRDQDKNVIKKICYTYNGQTENCNVYYNTTQTGYYAKNNCPSGYSGSTVAYTIPAGTYSSTISVADANNKAWDDILANGQAYANATGTCTPVSSCSPSNCTGEGYKCVYGNCELGVKVYTSMAQISSKLWECTYHYEWSDGSWSGNYTEQSPKPCSTIIE